MTQKLFESIPDEDVDLLNISGRPEHLLVTVLPVPPVCIRPSVDSEETGNSEDDITISLIKVI